MCIPILHEREQRQATVVIMHISADCTATFLFAVILIYCFQKSAVAGTVVGTHISADCNSHSFTSLYASGIISARSVWGKLQGRGHASRHCIADRQVCCNDGVLPFMYSCIQESWIWGASTAKTSLGDKQAQPVAQNTHNLQKSSSASLHAA